MIENKKSLSLLRTRIDKLDTQLWATIGERISIWTDVNKEKKILYREMNPFSYGSPKLGI